MIISSELVHGLTKTQDPREGYMCMCSVISVKSYSV